MVIRCCTVVICYNLLYYLVDWRLLFIFATFWYISIGFLPKSRHIHPHPAIPTSINILRSQWNHDDPWIRRYGEYSLLSIGVHQGFSMIPDTCFYPSISSSSWVQTFQTDWTEMHFGTLLYHLHSDSHFLVCGWHPNSSANPMHAASCGQSIDPSGGGHRDRAWTCQGRSHVRSCRVSVSF